MRMLFALLIVLPLAGCSRNLDRCDRHLIPINTAAVVEKSSGAERLP